MVLRCCSSMRVEGRGTGCARARTRVQCDLQEFRPQETNCYTYEQQISIPWYRGAPGFAWRSLWLRLRPCVMPMSTADVSMSCLRTPAVPSIQVLPSFERRTASRGRRSREEQGDESAGGSACFSTRCARRGQILQCTRRWSQGGPPSVPRQLQARGCRQPHNVSEWSLNHKLHVGAAYELSSSDVAGVMHVCAPSLQVRFVV
jgi:hypothetical protein